jgi:solute carrier family 45 protein 1/2/4
MICALHLTSSDLVRSVAIVAGTLLPYLAARDRRLLAPEQDERTGGERDDIDEEQAEYDRIREMVRQWKMEAAREEKPLKLPTMPFMLRNIWTSAMLLFFVLMMSTMFVDKVWQATVVIALVGICWAVACWVCVRFSVCSIVSRCAKCA